MKVGCHGLLLLWGCLTNPVVQAQPIPTPRPGLIFAVESAGTTHSSVVSNLWLFVAEGRPPSPFSDPGPFTATWTGRVSVDLRSELLFQAELSGELDLEINGASVLRAAGTNTTTPHTALVRLKKGPNALKAVYRGARHGNSHLRISWAEKPFLTTPIPHTQLDHLPTAASQLGEMRLHGRDLFLQHRCAACHVPEKAGAPVPELSIDAPAFDGIGARRSRNWMRRWIENPRTLRSQAAMPRLLHGAEAATNAAAIAAYLSSLQMEKGPSPKDPAPWVHIAPVPPGAGEGRPLLDSLLCASCHRWPGSEDPDDSKISLEQVALKFPRGRLEEFLMRPEAHYRWIRMPNFRLTQAESRQLASELLARLGPPPRSPEDPMNDERLIELGRMQVATSGCMSCHSGPEKNRFTVRSLGEIPPASWTRGCMAGEASNRGKAPDFGFDPAQLAALREFGATDRKSLSRHVPSEFASRHKHALRCTSCHGHHEGFPGFDVLGGKLRPEWMAQFVAGELPYKPREVRHPNGEPWMEARMPAFPAYARPMAEGMAEAHGCSPVTPSPTAFDPSQAAIGRKLLGKTGGLSCTPCHGVGSVAAMEVFDSEGINLAYSSQRLRKDYFLRWMKQPIAIDPATKMPGYFDDEGRSPLTEILGGDALRQLEALWEYLKPGAAMVPPAAGE